MLSPFHSETSKKVTVREALESMALTKKMERILDSESSYDELFSFRLKEDVSSECDKAIDLSYEIWHTAPQNLKDKMNLIISEGNNSFLKKCQKGTIGFNDKILPSKGVYDLTNRKQESAFGHLKFHDKKFLSMARNRLGDLAISHINKCAEWLQSFPENISTDMIKNAKKREKLLFRSETIYQ